MSNEPLYRKVLHAKGYHEIVKYIDKMKPERAEAMFAYWERKATEGHPWHSSIVAAVAAERLKS